MSELADEGSGGQGSGVSAAPGLRAGAGSVEWPPPGPGSHSGVAGSGTGGTVPDGLSGGGHVGSGTSASGARHGGGSVRPGTTQGGKDDGTAGEERPETEAAGEDGSEPGAAGEGRPETEAAGADGPEAEAAGESKAEGANDVAGAGCGEAAASRPEASARPAAARTSAADWAIRQGRRSPQVGHAVAPGVPVCASTISRAVRASTLSGFTYAFVVATASAPLGGSRGVHAARLQFTPAGVRGGRVSADRCESQRTGANGRYAEVTSDPIHSRCLSAFSP